MRVVHGLYEHEEFFSVGLEGEAVTAQVNVLYGGIGNHLVDAVRRVSLEKRRDDVSLVHWKFVLRVRLEQIHRLDRYSYLLRMQFSIRPISVMRNNRLRRLLPCVLPLFGR